MLPLATIVYNLGVIKELPYKTVLNCGDKSLGFILDMLLRDFDYGQDLLVREGFVRDGYILLVNGKSVEGSGAGSAVVPDGSMVIISVPMAGG